MSLPLQTILDSGALDIDPFPANSRYHGIARATLSTADGRNHTYLRRRFIPPPGRFAVIHMHQVVAGDRLDVLAANYIGDPELFWRICDANNAMRPEDLTREVGRRLRITLPEGVPGSSNV